MPHARRRRRAERQIGRTIALVVGKWSLRRISCGDASMVLSAGFIVAWTPYAGVVCIRIFFDPVPFPPMLATVPAIISKTSLL